MELQETRRHIVEILKAEDGCTVEEIVAKLSERLLRPITTVTVRHHLERLRAEALVEPPKIRRRNSPGRPQYVYSLSQRAMEYFPNDYAGFAAGLLDHVKRSAPENGVNVLLEGMADSMAADAMIPDVPLPKRLNYVVAYMNDKGYEASWETGADGYILTACNCPYEAIVGAHEEICEFDARLLASMLGVVPRLMNLAREGGGACQYLIPDNGESK